MSQDSCPSPPSDASECGSPAANDRADSGSSPTLDELISGLGSTEDEAASAAELEPDAKRQRVEKCPGSGEKRSRRVASESSVGEPAAKKARTAEEDDEALDDLTQMKPGASPPAAAEEETGEDTQRTASSAAASSTPLVWMYRTAPFYRDTKFGMGQSKVLFEGIDFAFAGKEARQMEPKVVKLGGRVVSGSVLDSHLHSPVYVAGLWGYTPTCMLISTAPQRTLKYIYALALGVPCVHAKWLQHCIDAMTLLPYQPYILPSGFSAEKSKMVLKSRLLSGLVASVIGPVNFAVCPPHHQQHHTEHTSTRMASKQEQWSRILQAAGCTYVAWDDVVARQRGAAQPEAVVVHCGATPEEQAQMALARFASTHFVSPEWVVQCLVHQRKLPYTGNAHYCWDYHRPPATDRH